MRRVLVFFAAAVVLFMGAHLRARAMSEICPASLDVVAIGPSNARHTQGDTFAFTVGAQSPRSLQGRLVLYTDEGWFAAAIPKVDLNEKVAVQQSEPTAFWRSPIFSVTLPVRVTIRRAFLADIITDAQTWYPPAPTTCLQGVDAGYSDAKPGTKPNSDFAKYFSAAPVSGPFALHAVPTAPLGSTACAEPFKRAVATDPVTPARPDLGPPPQPTPAVVDVGIILRSDGTVQEAWPAKSSGFRALDEAAVKAAEDSVYEPAISLCQAVPSEYIFVVTFSY